MTDRFVTFLRICRQTDIQIETDSRTGSQLIRKLADQTVKKTGLQTDGQIGKVDGIRNAEKVKIPEFCRYATEKDGEKLEIPEFYFCTTKKENPE